MAWSDADDASLTVQRGGDVEVVVDVEGHTLRSPEAVKEDGGGTVGGDGVDGLVRTGGRAADEERSGGVEG